MTRRTLAVILLAGGVAHAQPASDAAPPSTVDQHLAQVRVLYDKGDFVHARDELLAAYALEPRPELLFALGQVEINLRNYPAAIDYYQRFIATGPAAEQVALAQQAIGAARARLADKPAPPPPPRPQVPPHRTWDVTDSAIAAAGSAAIAAGAGLLLYTHTLTDDRTGTLHEYSDRLSRATITQWTGIASLAGGTIAVGAALLRWRLHFVGGELRPAASATTAGATWVRPW